MANWERGVAEQFFVARVAQKDDKYHAEGIHRRQKGRVVALQPGGFQERHVGGGELRPAGQVHDRDLVAVLVERRDKPGYEARRKLDLTSSLVEHEVAFDPGMLAITIGATLA